MKPYNALLHQVELLTTMMGLSILSMVISSFAIFHAQGTGSPIRKEADEEIKGKAATKKTEQATRDGPQPSQNVNKKYCNPIRDIVNNPLGCATNNQPTEAVIIAGDQIEMNDAQETGDQLPQGSEEKHLGEVDGNHRQKSDEEKGSIPIEQKSAHGMASSPKTDTKDKEKELKGTTNDIPQLAIAFQISWGVIGLSTTMLGVYLGLLGNNKNVSDQMVLYEVSLWLLYTSLFLGLIMLMITIIHPLLCSFIYGLMALALLSKTYAINLGIHILLSNSTFKLVIGFVLPTALFLVAMILYFKDLISKDAQKFGFKRHQN